MKRQGVWCLLTGLCLVLGGLAQGPTIGPCSAPNTTENFNDAYISKLTDGDYEVVHPAGQSSSTSQLRFYHNGTYLLTYIDLAGRSAQHTGEYRAQAHAASAPATITLHSLPSGAFGSAESGTVKLSVVRAEEGIIELLSCARAGLVIYERRHLLISTMLHRSGVEAATSLNPVILDTMYAYPDLRLGRQDIINFNPSPEARKFFIILAAINCLFNLFKKPDYCGSLLGAWKNATSNLTFYSALPSPPPTVLYNFEPVFATYPVPTYSWSRYALQPSAFAHNSMQARVGPVYAQEVGGIPYFAHYFENFGNREQHDSHQSPQLVGAPITGQYNFFIPR
ncbi:uncharacterized protein LOC108678367 [Hyalella azteca]|uniref:Uncharacterized protein LOC108678367 n=1 Tax=Hyalella azteca TaxID=294128 RepID=A0A8B7P7W6_HYAAZ|nr:uncharacterized protein LOC108678367 [Hyalella azteca]